VRRLDVKAARELVAVAFLGVSALAPTAGQAQGLPPVGGPWSFQGPGPMRFGQVEGIVNGPVSGAVQTVVAHPTDANTLWLGATNGGLWKTTNALDASPTWVPLIDGAASLSIGALELDPTDTTHQTLVAAIGRQSSFSRNGGPRVGLLRTVDGGTHWTLLTGAGALDGRNFAGVAPRGSTIVVSANFFAGCLLTGIYRSTDTGASFVKVSGTPGTGLPGGEVFDLAGDPTNPAVLYAAVRNAAACTPGFVNGIYKSIDTGATWTKVSNAAMDALASNNTNFNNAEIAVGRSGEVYAGLMNVGRLAGLFRSGDGGASWIALDTPATNENGSLIGIQPSEHPGGQGSIHFSIRADPTDPNIVYLGGDRQPGGGDGNAVFPNSLGAVNYSGRLFRVNASFPPGSQATSLTHCAILSAGCPTISTLSNSAPHADSREMTFDAAGNLIEGDDGGIFRRTNPRGVGDWFSVNGTLAVTEFHSVAYDAVSKMVFAGAQDNGTSEQRTVGTRTWTLISTGDGGDVQIDDRSSPSQSIRYSSFQNLLNLRRRTVNAAGVPTSTVFPARTVLNGGPAFVGQFVTPVEVNAVDPARILFAGVNDLYESLDRGDTVTALGFNLAGTPASRTAVAMVFGGVSGGVPNPDLLYALNGLNVYVRTTGGGAPVRTTGLAGGATATTLRDIAVDPADWTHVYVIDALGRVFASADTGATWSNVTGNLPLGITDLRTIVFAPGTPSALLVGGQGGVFRMPVDSAGTWSRLGTGLPNVLVWDLEYDAADNVVVAGTLGRGAWAIGAPSIPSVSTLSIDDIARLEGNVPNVMTFTVTLLPASTETVTVGYSTADGTATAGSDYTAVSGTLTFAPGVTVQTIAVPISGDVATELDEMFFVNLGAAGAPASRTQGRGTLYDDDFPAIAGTVTDAGTGLPIAGLTVSGYNTAGTLVTSSTTDALGGYFLYTGIAPGTYFLRTGNNLGYVNELYDNIPCNTCTVTTGTPVVVDGSILTGIDFALATGGRVSGQVTDAVTGAGLSGVTVAIYNPAGTLLTNTTTDATGSYTIIGLPTGSYRARTSNAIGYADEVFNDFPCAPCNLVTGTPINVTAPLTTTGVSFALGRGGRISGTVKDANTAAPLSGVLLQIYTAANALVAGATTDAAGAFTTSVALPGGTYFARTGSAGGYLNELYSERPCPPVTCVATEGTPITVTPGVTTTGIHFTLTPGGRFSGLVRSAAGAPLSLTVEVYDTADALVASTTSAADGRYTTGPLLPGTYFTRTRNAQGFVDEAYDNQACAPCRAVDGTAVTVTAGATTNGIDFTLDTGGRIAGTVTDGAGAGQSGVGVLAYTPAGTLVASTVTGGGGAYQIATGLPPGPYLVRTANSAGLIDELYDDVVCPPCSPADGRTVDVTAGAIASGIDFALAAGGRIAGRVTDVSTAAPRAGVGIDVFDTSGNRVGFGATDAAGRYLSGSGLPSGRYFARTTPAFGHAKLYDDLLCIACDPRTGTPIAVTAPAITDGIDFRLFAGPVLSIDSVRVPEGDAGASNASFTVNLSAPIAQSVTVEFLTADVTAVAGDYAPAAGTLAFPAGTTTQSIAVSIHGDTLNEDDETFAVALTAPTNAAIGVTSGVGTIVDDDPLPALSIADVSVGEGGAAVFTVTLSAPSGRRVTVDFATADGTARSGADYTAASGSLTFAPGETLQTITAATTVDNLDEADETFVVRLINPSRATLAAPQATGTISDDDDPPALSITGATAGEGGPVVFRVGLSAPSGRPVTVDFATADGTARAGSDYAAASGALTFAPGETAQTLSVSTAIDPADEDDETFVVRLANPSHATLAVAEATGTIADDDALPALAIADATGRENGGALAFTVSLSAASGRTVTVAFATVDGTARAGLDYAATTGSLTFAPGTTTQVVSVGLIADGAGEPDEGFAVTLSGAAQATIADGAAAGTIVNDDGARVAPVADAYVRDGDDSRTNFGRERVLLVKHRSTRPDLHRRSYLRFDLAPVGLTRVSRARLRLFLRDVEGTRPRVKAFSVADDSWQETHITWRNQPARTALLAAAAPAEGWVELDVTAFVNQQLSGDRRASFALLDDTDGNTLLTFDSREATSTSRRPELVLEP
jgi:hypothetical protein